MFTILLDNSKVDAKETWQEASDFVEAQLTLLANKTRCIYKGRTVEEIEGVYKKRAYCGSNEHVFEIVIKKE